MTDTAHAEATYAYVGALVEELARAGVRHACICPGSRSTPLAFALAAHPSITPWVHIDERSSSFFALGLAKASGTPVVLVCTSGTAAAEFLPAVVEARYGRVPLVVLTADRPPELRDNGAPQAIDQLRLYGTNVKWFVEMALPEASERVLRYARTTAARAVATAVDGPAGPVHLNLPFREPLTPPADFFRRVATRTARERDYTARFEGRPYIGVVAGTRTAPREELEALARELGKTLRGVIVCGPGAGDGDGVAAGIVALSETLGYPVLADPLSGLRCGPRGHEAVLDAYDALLRDERAEVLTPDVTLRIGAAPTSKALSTVLRLAERQILVDAAGEWRDPTARVDTIVRADAGPLCAAIVDVVERERDRYNLPALDDSWLDTWRDADRRARGALRTYLEGLDEPFEGKVFAELADLLPDGATLYVGNSMPVRDLDTFFRGNERAIRFLCNRGANGIDGVVSSALGAAARGDGPLVLVIGDLSFYHDLNGLLAAKRYPINATIVLLNNDGGGIFSFLPQAGVTDAGRFEQLFGTPTGLDFELAARMYGCGYERVETWAAFRAALAGSLAAPGVRVLELRTDRARNVELHRACWTAVSEAVWRA